MNAIISRSSWGAQFQDGHASRPVGDLEVWGHNTVTGHSGKNATFAQDCAAVRTVERVGQQRFGVGMSYPFLIPPSGRIFMGVSPHRVSPHTLGHNTGGSAIAYIGNYDNEQLTAEQIAATAWLLWKGQQEGWWKTDRFTGVHGDVFPTSCCGRNAIPVARSIRAKTPSGTTAVASSVDGGGHGFFRVTRNDSLRDGPLSTNKNVRQILEGELCIAGPGSTRWWKEIGQGLWAPHGALEAVEVGGATDVLHHGMWPDRPLPLTGVQTNEWQTAWREYLWRAEKRDGHLHRERKQWLNNRGYIAGHGPEMTGQYWRAWARMLRDEGHYAGDVTQGARFEDPEFIRADKAFLNSRVAYMLPQPPSASEKYRGWKGKVR